MTFDSEQQKQVMMATLKPQLAQAQEIIELCQSVWDGKIKKPKKKKSEDSDA